MRVADLDSQERFGPYRVVRLVGSGGMGSVFEAEDTGLGHRVALKLLHPHVARVPGAAERFLREGRAAARVTHPHVVQVFALGIEGESPYLAMELLDGDDLAQVIARKGRLPIEEALDLVLPILAGVAAAHEAGVIHRDLKPSNICFTRGRGGRLWPKVVDFGVSKVIAACGASEAASIDGVIGTAAYMAPEQARAACNASFRSDQYSLAVLLYQCLTGELPFSGRGVVEIVESIMTAPFVPPGARVRGLPKALDEAVLRATSRDPEERFPSVRAFGEALLGMASERTRLAFAAELTEAGESAAAATGHAAGDVVATYPATGWDELTDTPMSPTATDGTLASPAHFERAIWAGAAIVLVGSLLLAGAAVLDPGNAARVPHSQADVSPAPGVVVLAPRSEVDMIGMQEPAPSASPVASLAALSRAAAAAPKSRSTAPQSPSSAPLAIGDNGAPILP